MKPFLCIDLTDNKKNEQENGEEWLVAKPSSALVQSLERSTEHAEQTIEKSKLPLPIRIVKWIFGIAGFVIIAAVVDWWSEEESITFREIYQNMPWLFWVAGACLVVWGVLMLLGIIKAKRVLETDESSQVFDHYDKTCEAIFADLGVPADATEIDVLTFFYKVKDGEVKVCEKALQAAPYVNPVYRVFVDEEQLYLANLEGKYAIPLSAVQAIRSLKKTICILEWNKDEPYNKGIYKQYKLSEDDKDRLICKGYHVVEFTRENELWGLYIPCYELPVIEALTGVTADSF